MSNFKSYGMGVLLKDRKYRPEKPRIGLICNVEARNWYSMLSNDCIRFSILSCQVYETAAKLGPVLQVGEKFVYQESSNTSLPESEGYTVSESNSKSSFV